MELNHVCTTSASWKTPNAAPSSSALPQPRRRRAMTSCVSSAQAPYIAGRKMSAKGWTKSSGGVEPEIISPTMGERKSSASAAGHVRSCLGRVGVSSLAGCATVAEVVSIRLLAVLCRGALSHRVLGGCSIRSHGNGIMFCRRIVTSRNGPSSIFAANILIC